MASEDNLADLRAFSGAQLPHRTEVSPLSTLAMYEELGTSFCKLKEFQIR